MHRKPPKRRDYKGTHRALPVAKPRHFEWAERVECQACKDAERAILVGDTDWFFTPSTPVWREPVLAA